MLNNNHYHLPQKLQLIDRLLTVTRAGEPSVFSVEQSTDSDHMSNTNHYHYHFDYAHSKNDSHFYLCAIKNFQIFLTEREKFA